MAELSGSHKVESENNIMQTIDLVSKKWIQICFVNK